MRRKEKEREKASMEVNGCTRDTNANSDNWLPFVFSAAMFHRRLGCFSFSHGMSVVCASIENKKQNKKRWKKSKSVDAIKNILNYNNNNNANGNDDVLLCKSRHQCWVKHQNGPVVLVLAAASQTMTNGLVWSGFCIVYSVFSPSFLPMSVRGSESNWSQLGTATKCMPGRWEAQQKPAITISRWWWWRLAHKGQNAKVRQLTKTSLRMTTIVRGCKWPTRRIEWRHGIRRLQKALSVSQPVSQSVTVSSCLIVSSDVLCCVM